MKAKASDPKTTTPRKVRHRLVAQRVLQGKTYEEIAKEVSPDVKYPRQTVYNTVHQPGVQAEIAQLVDESNVLAYVTVERIIRNIQELAFDKTLKPKEREGYLRMLAEYKALLKQVNLNETVTSSDALVGEAEKALAQLKADTRADVLITSNTLTSNMAVHTHDDTSTDSTHNAPQSLDVAPGRAIGTEGENEATPSGKGVEATPANEGEKD